MGLSVYGDPEALDRLASRLEAHADEVRQHAADHVRRGHAARWESVAAQAYRDRIDRDRAEADRAAEQMDRAAAVLRAHAQQVRDTIALIERYEREVTAWFSQQVGALANAVDGAVDAAGRLVRKVVSDPPWRTWPVGPDSLPPPGDKGWLEVGRFMTRQGIF